MSVVGVNPMAAQQQATNICQASEVGTEVFSLEK
jgi:hypothetical protein